MRRRSETSPPPEMPYTAPPDTPMHSMASLMDAKLADEHAELERNMEVLQRILQLLERRLELDGKEREIDRDKDFDSCF